MRTTTVRAALAAVLLAGLAACSAEPNSPVPTQSAASAPAPAPAPESPSDAAQPPAGGHGIWPLYYLDAGHSPSRVKRWDGPGTTPVDLPSTFVGSLLNSNVSPDGHYGSWVDADTSVLHVVDLRTGQTVLTRDHVDAYGMEPAWAPDSRRLLIGDITTLPANSAIGTAGVLDVASRTFTPLAHPIHGIHLTWSADGTAIAYATGTGEVVVADADGSNQRTVPGLRGDQGPQRSFDIESVGPGGRLISLWVVYPGMTNGDIGRSLTINAIADSRTGSRLTLTGFGVVEQALLPAEGSMVLRVNAHDHHRILVLPENAGTATAAYDEPASLNGWQLLNA